MHAERIPDGYERLRRGAVHDLWPARRFYRWLSLSLALALAGLGGWHLRDRIARAAEIETERSRIERLDGEVRELRRVLNLIADPRKRHGEGAEDQEGSR